MTDKKKKRVLVTGAAGFIGSFLCPRLIREGYAVTALDIDESKAAHLKKQGIKEVNFVSIPFALAWGLGYLNDKLLRPLNVKITVTRHTVGLTGRDNRVDTSRARNELGWNTRVSYQEAVAEIGRWIAIKSG